MISVVSYGSNDNYGFKQYKRTAMALNRWGEVLHPSDEIVFVDYGSPATKLTLPEAIIPILSQKAKTLIKVVRVRSDEMAPDGTKTEVPINEALARNIGIRRSNSDNRWLISTNADIVPIGISRSKLERIQNGYLIAQKIRVPWRYWDNLTATDTREVVRCFERDVSNFEAYPRRKDQYLFALYHAPGDLQTALREDFFNIRGFEEKMAACYYVDVNWALKMHRLKDQVYDANQFGIRIFHLEHDVGDFRIRGPLQNSKKIWLDEFKTTQNSKNWGLADQELPVFNLSEKDIDPHYWNFYLKDQHKAGHHLSETENLQQMLMMKIKLGQDIQQKSDTAKLKLPIKTWLAAYADLIHEVISHNFSQSDDLSRTEKKYSEIFSRISKENLKHILYENALVYWYAKKKKLSLKLFAKIGKGHSQWLDSKVYQAIDKLSRKQTEAGHHILKEVLTIEPDYFRFLNRLAIDAVNNESYDIASDLFALLLEYVPMRFDIKMCYGFALLGKKDIRQGKNVLADILKYNLQRHYALSVRAQELKDAGRYDEAVAVFEVLLSADSDSDNIDMEYQKGLSLASLGRYSEALKVFDEVLNKKPGYLKVRLNKADIYRYRKQFDQSAAELEIIASVDEEFTGLCLKKAQLHIAKGEQLEAGEYFFREYQNSMNIDALFSAKYCLEDSSKDLKIKRKIEQIANANKKVNINNVKWYLSVKNQENILYGNV